MYMSCVMGEGQQNMSSIGLKTSQFPTKTSLSFHAAWRPCWSLARLQVESLPGAERGHVARAPRITKKWPFRSGQNLQAMAKRLSSVRSTRRASTEVPNTFRFLEPKTPSIHDQRQNAAYYPMIIPIISNNSRKTIILTVCFSPWPLSVGSSWSFLGWWPAAALPLKRSLGSTKKS